MARRISIPLLADLVIVDRPDDVQSMADHDALDRRFVDTGPFLNRALAARIRHGLRVGHTRLPSALVREDATRLAQADALSERLVPGAWDEASLRALAEFVEGRTRRPLGELVQEAVGRLFKPNYVATKETWQAAQAMEAHLRSWNPITRIIADIRGELRNAQRVLSEGVAGDLAGVHATGIALHNLLPAMEQMRSDWRNQELRDDLAPMQAAMRALEAPQMVVRQATRPSDSIAGTLNEGTLVLLSTRKAGKYNADVSFLSNSWSRCPADQLVPAMLAEIWRLATEPADQAMQGEAA